MGCRGLVMVARSSGVLARGGTSNRRWLQQPLAVVLATAQNKGGQSGRGVAAGGRDNSYKGGRQQR